MQIGTSWVHGRAVRRRPRFSFRPRSRTPSLSTWNVLFDTVPLGAHALSVQSVIPAALGSTPPLPAPFNVLDALSFPKHCKCCDRRHTAEDWSLLRYIGMQFFTLPTDDPTDDPIPPLELRNCECGTTLAIEVES